jgi:hypothetical protein
VNAVEQRRQQAAQRGSRVPNTATDSRPGSGAGADSGPGRRQAPECGASFLTGSSVEGCQTAERVVTQGLQEVVVEIQHLQPARERAHRIRFQRRHLVVTEVNAHHVRVPVCRK